MDFIVTLYDGSQYTLPALTAFRLEYGLGSPCDGFWLRCPWSLGREKFLGEAVGLTVKRNGAVVFAGVVDECEFSIGREGRVLEMSGRGMQALLLDNEAAAVDFGLCTLEDILSRYVTPYGIKVAESAKLPAVQGFSVSMGSSCWQVLYQFARYHGGVTPRFDREGRLLLSAFGQNAASVIDDTVPLTRLTLREKRYGVLSQVQVVNRVAGARETVSNEAFRREGGRASRVITVPRQTGYQAMRYSGQFQLGRSEAERRRIELCAPLPFLAFPGELVNLQRGGFGLNGNYRVIEARVSLGQEGYETALVLGSAAALV